MSILGGLIPLVVIGLLVAGGVAIARRVGGHEGGGEDGTLRRVVTSLVLLGLLILAATGVAQVIGLFLPGETIVDRGAADAARALALTVVGVPGFFLAWRFQMRMLERPQERASVAWPIYLTLVTLVFGIGSVVGLINGLRWVFDLGPRAPTALALGVVWGLVWVWHDRVVVLRVPPERIPEAPSVAGSAIGLVLGTGALIGAFGTLLSEAYRTLTEEVAIASGFGDRLFSLLLWSAAGIAVWAWQWVGNARHREASLLRSVYTLVLGVFGGGVVALAALGSILYTILAAPFADVDLTDHFDTVPALVAAAVVGWAVWRYHRSIVLERPAVLETETGFAYHYLLAGAGLVAAASGLGVIVNAGLAAIIPAIEARNQGLLLAGGLAALLVGMPVWWRTWRPTVAPSEAEVRSTSRRTYLTVLAGLGSVVGVVSLIIFVFGLFEGIIDGERFSAIVDSVRASLGVLVGTGVVAWYHVRIWRAERHVAAERELPGPKTITLVAAGSTDAAVEAIETRFHARVRVLRQAHAGEAGPVDANLVVEALEGIEDPEVLVIAVDGRMDAIPVERV